MSSTFRTLGQSELLPRYIFAESLYARRRVLEIGAVASTLGQSARFLSTRGARIVVAADSDLAAVADAQTRLATPSLRFRASVFDDLEANSFDLVIVADLAPYVRAPELLKEVARLVARNGYLMGGLRNPAGLSLANVMESEGVEATPTYGMLLDALSSHFRSIEVATQSPVLGYQLAFEKGEGLQVDGSLAGLSEAAYYVVLAGHEPVRFFDPTWVQLPPEPLAFTGGKLEEASGRARSWQERSDRLKESLGKTRDEVTRRELELKESKEQLEGARENVARLTAQVEAAAATPKQDGRADELTSKVRRLEAELTIARERALDAEGRVGAMRSEVELHQREQKHATVETLAAQENARLERTRREEQLTQLEDTRARLTKAYEELRLVQDEAAAHRVEVERAKLEGGRVAENLAAKERELQAAKDRELRLADAHGSALAAVEGLQRELERQRASLSAAEAALGHKEAERLALLRSLELESTKALSVDTQLQAASAQVQALAAELAQTHELLTAAQTEVEAGRAAQARLKHDIETLASSERTWREMAQQYEGRLNETLANVTALSEQVAQLEAAKEQEVARFNRLEKDLSTAIGAERSAREQAQAQLADAQARGQELGDDNQRLLEQRDDFEASVGDLTRARGEDARRLEEQTGQLQLLSTRIHELEADLQAAQARQVELQDQATAAEAALRQSLSEREQAWSAEKQALVDARAALQAELEQGRALAASLQQQLEGSQSAAAALRAELQQAQHAHEGLGAELAQQRSAAAQVDLKLGEAVQHSEALKGELEQTRTALQAQVQEQQRAIAGLNELLERGQKTLDGVRAELAAHQREAAKLEADRGGEIAALRAELEQRQREATKLEADRGGEIAALRAELEQRQREATKLEADRGGEITALKANLEQRQREAAQREADRGGELAGLKAELEQRQREAAQLEADRGGEIAGLKGELERRQQALAALQQQLDELELKHAETLDLVAERAGKVADLSERLREAIELSDLEREDFQARLAEASSGAGSVSKERDAARGELARLTGQLEQGRQRVAELAQRAARLETESGSLRSRLAEVEAQATERLAKVEDLSARLRQSESAAQSTDQELRSQLQTLTGDLAAEREAARAAAEQAQQAHQQLQESHQALKSRAVDREREFEQLKESLGATEAARTRLEEVLAADRTQTARSLEKLTQELSQGKDELDRRAAQEAALRAELHELTEALELTREEAGLFKAEATKAAEVAAASARAALEQATERAARDLAEAREAAEAELLASKGALQQRFAELEAESSERRVEFEARRGELERRVVELTEQVEHLEAELAFGAETRTAEAELREKVERERDQLKEEASTVKGWVVGGKAENQKLAGDLDEARADLERTRQELLAARTNYENSQRELEGSRQELAAQRQAAEAKATEQAAVASQLNAARTELGLASQQVQAAKAELERVGAEAGRSRDELAAVQQRLDAEAAARTQDAERSTQAHLQQLKGLELQLESARNELQLFKGTVERAQSEARGHQAAKLLLQAELDKVRGELTQVKNSLAISGGEAKAIAEARAKVEAQLAALQGRAEQAESSLAKAQSHAAEAEANVAQAQEREKGLEAQIAQLRGSTAGSAGDLDAAVQGRRTAEELLLKMRARYTELEAQLSTEVPALREQLSDAQGDNQLLDAERERLAGQVERLEQSRNELTSRLDAAELQVGKLKLLARPEENRANALEAQLKTLKASTAEKEQRFEMMQRRLNAQEAELQALRRRGTTATSSLPIKPPAARPSAQPVVRGTPLTDLDLTPKGPVPIVKPAPEAAGSESLELEVFELDVDAADDEELVLLEDEASDPGSKDPRKP